MIILHNPHDKDSRDFIEKYKTDNIIIEYPECLEQYPYVSGFPSVIVDLPKKIIEEFTVPSYINQETNEEMPPVVMDMIEIEAHQEIVRMPRDWQDVENFIQTYIDYDPGKGYR